MCGICGVHLFDRERRVSDAEIVAMRDTMVHRGPDGFGNHLDGHVGLGHRRLSIVDVAGGHQPMSNEDGSVWVSFNGEIYNHADLRPGLERKGHQFRTHCDTEAIVHLYEEEDESAFARMIGMFAIAIYDRRRDRTVLARDRLGIKPLYYTRTSSALLFASEIKALLAHPDVAAEVNWSRLSDFFVYGGVYGPETLFKNVFELPPGHVLIAHGSDVKIVPFWTLQARDVEERTEADARARVRELLERSIRRRLMSDVPLGAFLSGGVDSSLIVALMARMTSDPVKTFSIGFAEDGYNEFQYSRVVASRFGTDHEEITLDSSTFFDALPDLIWHHDEPITLAASVPLYFLSRATKGKATVILTGEGADEVFLGYDKYQWSLKHWRRVEAFQRYCPEFARATIAGAGRRLLGADRLLFRRLTMTPGQVAESFNQVAQPSVVRDLLAGTPDERWMHYSAQCFEHAPGTSDFLRQSSYMDFNTFLITLLMKQDKMSMAAAIESRVPFLDHELVEYAYRLATDLKLRDGVGKRVLKSLAAELLPHDLIYRRKRGFPVPISPWLEHARTRSQFEQVLLDDRTVQRGIFKRDVLERYLRATPVAQRRATRGVADLMWNLVNFELWMRRFIDGRSRVEQRAPALARTG